MTMKEKKKNEKWSAFWQKHPEFYKFMKFNLVGVVGVPTEIGTRFLFTAIIFKSLIDTHIGSALLTTILGEDGATIGLALSFLFSTAIGETVGFILNRKFTFAADQNPALSIFLHICMVSFSIFMTAFVGMGLVSIISKWLSKESAIAISNTASTFIATIWLYPLNRFVVHRKKKPVVAPGET